MRQRNLAVIVVALLCVGSVGAVAEPLGPVPHHEPGFAHPALALGRCEPENVFDMPNYYGEDCKRLSFVFGPILAKPGQNDVLIQPTTIEKPAWAGYMVRNKPGLVEQLNNTPPVEDIHLHHGTWVNANRSYGSGPFWASGEEKTILQFPKGYGLLMKPDDAWLFAHMVHNATPRAQTVYVTYDIDFVAQDAAERVHGIRNTRQIWLDVMGGKFHPRAEGCCSNPIFNVQKGFGHPDVGSFQHVPGTNFTDGSGKMVCSFPKENCARFNAGGNVSAQQGLDVSDEVPGKDTTVGDAAFGDKTTRVGTLVVMGGHVHPGGLRDEISLVRDLNREENLRREAAGEPLLPENWVEKPIMISDTIYWDAEGKVSTSPTSWNFSHTLAGAQHGWRVLVRRGDKLRLNGVYDTDLGSWYMQMGIVMTWMSPGDTSGTDVFSDDVVLDTGFPTTAPLPDGISATCTPGTNAEGKTVLCLRGTVTRPSLEANRNHGGCRGDCPPLAALDGPLVDRIDIGGFTYGEADLSVVRLNGVPRVKVGQPLRFVNLDSAGYIWHSVTRCTEPCTGVTAVDYPLSDAGLGKDDHMDFDSSDMGVGLGAVNRIDWTFTPDRTGTYTFYCRIHPAMRGAFKVVA